MSSAGFFGWVFFLGGGEVFGVGFALFFFFNTVAFLVKMHFKTPKHSAIVWSY